MPGTKVLYFTEKDVEFTDLLIRIGFQDQLQRCSYFLQTHPKPRPVISSEDQSPQPEVSLGMQYLQSRGWIASRLEKTESIGRPQNIFSLSRPIAEIIDHIQTEKETEIRRKMALTQKIRSYIPDSEEARLPILPALSGRVRVPQSTGALLPKNSRVTAAMQKRATASRIRSCGGITRDR